MRGRWTRWLLAYLYTGVKLRKEQWKREDPTNKPTEDSTTVLLFDESQIFEIIYMPWDVSCVGGRILIPHPAQCRTALPTMERSNLDVLMWAGDG